MDSGFDCRVDDEDNMRRSTWMTILIAVVGLTYLLANPALAQSGYKYVGDFDPPGGVFSPQNNLWPPTWPTEGVPASLMPPQESPPVDEPNLNYQTDSNTPGPENKDQISKNAKDPDASRQMKLQWEMWHRRVAEAISIRFNGVAQQAFSQSRPISCEAAYTVTRDRQIVNVRLLHKSNNIVFNSMLLMVLKSMNGNSVLEFPPESKRESVEKTGEFTWHKGLSKYGFICDPPMDRQIQNKPAKD